MNVLKHLLLIMPVWCGANFASAQTWTQTSAPTKNWSSVACSADGSRLIAGINTGVIYSSTNFGITWATNNVPNLAWNSAASSADGSKLVAAYSGGVYTSTNFGATWKSNNVPNYSFLSAASTGDGSTIAAISLVDNAVHVSTNSGGSWATNYFPTNIVDGDCVGLSASGARLFAGNNGGIILNSTNLGTTWNLTNRLVSGVCKSIAVSADGAKVATCFGGKNIFLSTNAGASWISNSLPFTTFAVAISSDGGKLAVIGSVPSINSPVLTSTNFGANWVSNSLPFANSGSLALSADGNRLVAALYAGGIWASQSIPNPRLNIANVGANTKILWTIPSTNFVMQQSSDLKNWADMTNQPVLNLTNLQDEVVLSPPGSNVFYRLKTP